MRTLKLQMNLALENKWDRGMSEFSLENLNGVDCLLHGRKTGEGFIPAWAEVAADPGESDHALGKRFGQIPNIIFSNSLKESKWENTSILGGDIAGAIRHLKDRDGGDIMVYGGDSFVASLIQHDLVDEYFILANPAAIGNGKETFNPLRNDWNLQMVTCRSFSSGALLLHYNRIG